MNIALIFAGGVGSRMNLKAMPKQFLEIQGKPIIIYTIEHFEKHPEIDAICIVCVEGWIDYLKSCLANYDIKKVKWLVKGGKTALESQYNGLEAIQSDSIHPAEDIILIHDGVRPLINESIISDCIQSVKEYGSAITVAPAIETIIRIDDQNAIRDIFERSDCQLARAPQCFYLKDIWNAHEQAKQENQRSFIDSVSLMLHYGYTLYTVKGNAENIKVTSPADFYACRALLEAMKTEETYEI